MAYRTPEHRVECPIPAVKARNFISFVRYELQSVAGRERDFGLDTGVWFGNNLSHQSVEGGYGRPTEANHRANKAGIR